MDGASPTFLSLKAKRFVCISEVEKNATIKGNVYRTICDYKSKIKARPLFGEDQQFYPHFLLFACTNVPLDVDDKGKGTQRRTRILDMPYNFVESPKAANDRPANPDLESNFPAWNPSLFHLLCRVRHVLMGSADHVLPIPAEVSEAVGEELREPWMDALDAFKQTLEKVSQTHAASTAAEVREAFLNFQRNKGPPLEKRDVALKMAAQGFQEESKSFYDAMTHKRTTKRVYSLVFPGGGNGLVKLR